MRKFYMIMVALFAVVAAEARIVTITLSDGTVKLFASHELSSITFNDDGTLTAITYDGKTIEGTDALFDKVTIDDQPAIYKSFYDKMTFNLNELGLPVDITMERDTWKMNFLYPTVDPIGNPITMSAAISIPVEIMRNETKCDGILLYNHYTYFNRKEAPTLSDSDIERMLMANPLHLNYIIVRSDFYGFGATERFHQAYLQGSSNSRPTLDALLAAKQLIDAMGISYGPLVFNVGYSSGGYDALQVQKVRDMEYSDRISFNKTFAGGSPSDVAETYRQYIKIDSTAYNAVPLLLMVSTNETQKLGLKYEDVFQPEISARIDELILSKNYSSWSVCDSIGREKKIHEILTPAYVDINTPEYQAIINMFDQFNVENDWTPDPTQNIFIFHSRDDDYVPVSSARHIVQFLRENGFTPSIIPGKTNLQTNFFVKKLGHLKATFVYYIQTFAAIKAWPLMYSGNQLNPYYEALVNQPMSVRYIVNVLDTYGIDVRPLINKMVADVYTQTGMDLSQMTPDMVKNLLAQLLAPLGIEYTEMLEILQDSNIDIDAIVTDFVSFLNEIKTDDESALARAADGSAFGASQLVDDAKLQKILDAEISPDIEYQGQLFKLFTQTAAN